MTTSMRPVYVRGFGAETGFGAGRAALLDGIWQRRRADEARYFPTERHAALAGFPFNPSYVPLGGARRRAPRVIDGALAPAAYGDMMLRVVREACTEAGLGAAELSGRRVAVYFGGPGVQPEIGRFISHLQRNDADDVRYHRGIRHLTAENYDQDAIAARVARELGLAAPPITVYSASCSSFSAAFLAFNAVRSGAADIAVAATLQTVSLYDMLFLHSFGGIADKPGQPFAEHAEGTRLGGGACAMVLAAAPVQSAPRVRLQSMVMGQAAGSTSGGQSFTPDFRLLDRTIASALDLATCSPADIACVFPHGNGVRSSDRAEALAVRKRWGDLRVPVVSYKSQLGYLLAASSLVDCAILVAALARRSLPAFTAAAPLDRTLDIRLHADAPDLPLMNGAGLKIGIGIDGSVGAAVFEKEAA